jgi:hypothetical protein
MSFLAWTSWSYGHPDRLGPGSRDFASHADGGASSNPYYRPPYAAANEDELPVLDYAPPPGPPPSQQTARGPLGGDLDELPEYGYGAGAGGGVKGDTGKWEGDVKSSADAKHGGSDYDDPFEDFERGPRR